MERELASTEKRETELRSEVERLRSEVDTLKVPLTRAALSMKTLSPRYVVTPPNKLERALGNHGAYAERARGSSIDREEPTQPAARHGAGQ